MFEQKLFIVWMAFVKDFRVLKCYPPVSWITNGTSKTSCIHLCKLRILRFPTLSGAHFVNINGIIWPRCMLSLLGPRPVYKKKGLPCSYRSKILSNSLPTVPKSGTHYEHTDNLPMREEHPSPKKYMGHFPSQLFKSSQ